MKCDSSVDNNEAFILSENGVRQGDPLSSLLFSMAMHGVYAQIATRLRAGCYAFIDDSHGVGLLSECWTVWQELPQLLAPLGLQLNTTKCELTCFHLGSTVQHQADQDALASFMTAGVKVNDRCLKVLGCVVGTAETSVAEELCTNPKFTADQRVAFQRLPLLKKQTGMTALRYLTGTVLTNRLRAMTPASTETHAAEYDGYVLRAAHRLVGIAAIQGDTYDTQLRWPLRLGGFGLLSAVEIAPAAYIAGLACTLPSSPAFATVWRGDGELDSSWPLYHATADSIARIEKTEAQLISQCPVDLVAKVSASVLPANADTFVQHIRALSPSCLIQSAVSHRISTLSHIARVTAAVRRGSSGVAELARLRSLKAKESSLWLRVLATDRYLQLSDVKWQWAAQLRLGMPVPVYEPPDGTALCSHTAAANESGWHPLTCIPGSSRAITDRHNAVLSRLAHFARMLNVTPRIEPAGLAAEDERRPDIQLDLPDLTLLGDVSISHPAAKTWQRVTTSRGVEAVGDSRQAEKDGLYADMAERIDMKFGAFILYTYGGWHNSALSFIKQMGSAVDPATCLTSFTRWKHDLMEHIAIAVQRGNANIMIQHSQRIRGKTWPRRRRARNLPRRRPVSRSRARHLPGGDTDDGERQHQSDRAMACVARLIGLPGPEIAYSDHGNDEADSDAETERVRESFPSPMPSIIPETPLSSGEVAPREADMEVDNEAVTTAQQGEDVSTVNNVNTAMGAGGPAIGEGVEDGGKYVNRTREGEGRDDAATMRGCIVAAEDGEGDCDDNDEVQCAPDGDELGQVAQVLSDSGVGGSDAAEVWESDGELTPRV
jgi:Reverse transcriptase (RNA-dependent DNA polymerase)